MWQEGFRKNSPDVVDVRGGIAAALASRMTGVSV
jgi:hypothetical protein